MTGTVMAEVQDWTFVGCAFQQAVVDELVKHVGESRAGGAFHQAVSAQLLVVPAPNPVGICA